MPAQDSQPLAKLPLFFRALSDPTRLRLLSLLAGGEVCVCHLCETLGMVQPTVSRHLAYLKKAGLVAARREGQWMHYAWAETREAAVRNVMNGLRESFAKDSRLSAERKKLKKVCCQ